MLGTNLFGFGQDLDSFVDPESLKTAGGRKMTFCSDGSPRLGGVLCETS